MGLYKYLYLEIIVRHWWKIRRSISDIRIWRDKFLEKVEEIPENYYLQFMCATWNLGIRLSRNKTETILMVTDKIFPFLDLELLWDDSGKLEFQVHRKNNQLLKYLNKASTHTKATFKTIPNGVLNRFSKLTSRIEDNSNMSIK